MASKQVISRIELATLRYYNRNPQGKKAMEVVEEIYDEERGSLFQILFGGYKTVLFSPAEVYNIYQQAHHMRNHGAAFAEVGTFRGASAKAISEAKSGTALHLFDTFTGLPKVGGVDTRFKQGMFAADEKSVRDRLREYPNVSFHPGFFPKSASELPDDMKFSFVHLDVDLYTVTRDALEFFYPRMLPGGRILSHDYGQCEGVWTAFDEFVVDKPEEIEPVHCQVMIIKQ
jgi:hypothetical protein